MMNPHSNRPHTAACILTCLLGLPLAVGTAATPEYLSPQSLAAPSSGQVLYVAAATARQVFEVDLASGKLRSIALPANPNDLALSQDGTRLYVACGDADGQVVALDPAAGTVGTACRVGHSPSAVVPAPDGRHLFVPVRFENCLAVLELPELKETARIPGFREPVAAVLDSEGATLFVADHLPAGPSNRDVVAAVVNVVAVAQRKIVGQIELPNGSTSVGGMARSADGRFLYVTHTLARYQMPTTQLERGWMNTSALTVIDTAARKRLNTVLLDEVDLGAANPWGVATSPDNRWVIVAQAGTHELSVIDQTALLDRLHKVEKGERVTEVSLTAADVPNDLSFLVGLRRRIALPGKGPRGVAVAGARVCVSQYFSDNLAVLDLPVPERPAVRELALGPVRPMTVLRRGEFLFNDATMCFQHWQSCSSCHPDVRTDGMNWDLLNDGLGNPKNSKSLLFTHVTPPSMSLGVRESPEEAVRAGIRVIQFVVRPEEDAVAIDEFLKALKPLPSPHRVAGQLSPAAQRGEQIFRSAGCAACHPPPLFTDLKEYNVGTGSGREADLKFDTPTLVEVWRTAPYLHDGRAMTLGDLFRGGNPDDRHGRTSTLKPGELDDLIEYVLSL